MTLQELMDEDDVVQECKSLNKKLVDFLAKPETVETLLKMVLDEPMGDVNDKTRFKNSNIACELISSDANQITDLLVSTDSLIQSLLSFLERPEPLNPLQASFFSKIMGLLISRKSEEMFELVKCREGFVANILRHLGTSAVMDLLLRLITCIDAAECRSNCINWLNEQKLVQQLIQLIDASETAERNTNAAQTLCDIVRLGKDALSNLQEGPSSDALLLEVEKSESVSSLLDLMFKGDPCESAIVNGLYVLQALLEPKRTSDLMQEPSTVSDAEHLCAVVNGLSDALVPHLKELHHLLINPPKQHYAPMPTSLGPLPQPLGLTRLQVASLVTSLVGANHLAINAELASLGTVDVLVNLFFQFPFNNFLHTQVERCLSSIVVSTLSDNLLLNQLVKDFNLLEKVTRTFEENQEQQKLPGKQRLGHLGHLTRIANLLTSKISMGAEGHKLGALFEELPEETQQRWKTFTEGLLADTNRTNAIELGGASSSGGRIPSSSEDDDDIGYLNFHMDDNLQKSFADFQTQQMTNNFVDQFGYSEEEFGDQEESIGSPFMAKISSIDFELNMIEDNPTAAAMFEQACNDRIRQFDSADSDDEWDLKDTPFPLASDNRHSSTIPADENRRGSSKRDSYEDEEEEFGGEEMEEESDGSSDSEDDLDSPRLIRESCADKDARREGLSETKPSPVPSNNNSINHSPGIISNSLEDTKLPETNSTTSNSLPCSSTATLTDKVASSTVDGDSPAAEIPDGIDIDDIGIVVDSSALVNNKTDATVSNVASETDNQRENHIQHTTKDELSWCLKDASDKIQELSLVDQAEDSRVDGLKPEVSAS